MVFSDTPGVKVREISIGQRTSTIESHSTIYMLGTPGTVYDGMRNHLHPVSSHTNFIETFGVDSDSEHYADLVFKQFLSNSTSSRLPLQFIPVESFERYIFSVTEPLSDNTEHALTISHSVDGISQTISYTPDGDTVRGVRDAIVNAINSNATLEDYVSAHSSVNEDADGFLKVLKEGTVITIDTGTELNLSVQSDATTPVVDDFVDAMTEVFSAENDTASGFIIMPEAFEKFTTSGQRTTLISTLESVCNGANAVGIIDPPKKPKNINSVVAEKQLYGSPQGHLSYFAPWVKFDTGNEIIDVPPSPVVAGIWSYYMQRSGINKPILGTQKPLAGITGLVHDYKEVDSVIANPAGVNLIRNIPGAGNVIWGGRTISNDPLYRFSLTRVVMNVINQAAEKAFLPFIGQGLEITGTLYHDLRNTGESILFQLWEAQALYGDSPETAFLAVCDNTNNSDDDRNNGVVRVDLYAAVTNPVEQILVSSIRVAIGGVESLS